MRGAWPSGCRPGHHCADYILCSIEIIGLILSQFKNRVPLKLVLGAWAVLHHYNTAHRLNKNQVCYFYFLLPEDLSSEFILVMVQKVTVTFKFEAGLRNATTGKLCQITQQ